MHVKYLSIDGAHSGYASSDSATAQAALETIENPEKHLMNQDDIFEAEGGYAGLAVQFGGVSAMMIGLFAYRPSTLAYLKNAQLKWCGWFSLGAAGFIGHQIGQHLPYATGIAGKLSWQEQVIVHQHRDAFVARSGLQ